MTTKTKKRGTPPAGELEPEELEEEEEHDDDQGGDDDDDDQALVERVVGEVLAILKGGGGGGDDDGGDGDDDKGAGTAPRGRDVERDTFRAVADAMAQLRKEEATDTRIKKLERRVEERVKEEAPASFRRVTRWVWGDNDGRPA